MSEQQSVFALQQAMFDLMEKQWATVANSTVKTDAFNDWVQTYLQSAAHLQDTVNQSSNAWLQAFNLPTREEVSRTCEMVIDLEERVEKLEESITELSTQNARVVYLEHELSTLRSEYAALQNTVSLLSDKLALLAETQGAVPNGLDQPAPPTTKTRKTSRAKTNPPASDSTN